MYPLRWHQDPAPRLHDCLLAALSLSPHPFPPLISNHLNLLFGTQGRSWSLECVPYKQEMGGTERHLCSGAPQGPARSEKCVPLERLQGNNEPLSLHEGWCLRKRNAHQPSFHSPRKPLLTATSRAGPSDLGSWPLTSSIPSPQPHPLGLPSVFENLTETHLAPQPNGPQAQPESEAMMKPHNPDGD